MAILYFPISSRIFLNRGVISSFSMIEVDGNASCHLMVVFLVGDILWSDCRELTFSFPRLVFFQQLSTFDIHQLGMKLKAFHSVKTLLPTYTQNLWSQIFQIGGKRWPNYTYEYS